MFKTKLPINKILITLSLVGNLLLLGLLLSLLNQLGYLGRILVLFNANNVELTTDTLSSKFWWQDEVKYQAMISQNQQYNVCLFGDSISSALGNTLGNNTFNFAEPGMSTISQLEQLKILKTTNLKCKQAIIAIGTNDADYRTMSHQFIRNLTEIISQLKQMGATKITLIPAFYSTVAASRDPSKAGTIERVEEINADIRQVALTENIPIVNDAIQPLFAGKALKESLTIDGVHLNADGKRLYRQGLLKIIENSEKRVYN